MPKKIRELKAMLSRVGFVNRGGKGSHTNWLHPRYPGLAITIAGKDGDDAQRYQENKVAKLIRKMEQS